MSVTINPKEFWEKIGRMNNARDSFLIRPDEQQYFDSGKKECEFLIGEIKKRKIKSPGTVLEYGSGDGRVAVFMAKYAKKMICADIAESVLSLCRKTLEAKGVTNAEFCLVDNLEENSVDFLYSLQVVQHNPANEQRRIFENMYRVLKPGRAVIVHMPAIETRPSYKNSFSCMCFTREEVEKFAGIFDSHEIFMNNGDYFIFGKKKRDE